MADQDSGDRTEEATPKRLRDARRKGDVAKAKDVGPAVSLVFFALLLLVGTGVAAQILADLFSQTLEVATSRSFGEAGEILGAAALKALLLLSALVLVPLALAGLAAEFAQVGPLVTGEKLKFGLDKLDPVAGLKRMFGKDGLVELVKNLVKAALVVLVTWLVLRSSLTDIGSIGLAIDPSPVSTDRPAIAVAVGSLTGALTLRLFGWTCAVFVFVAAADRLWAKYSYAKKMRMSMRDVRQEHKQDEGDPHLKSSRKQLHEEFANQNAVGATRGAAALLVNPTHLAIALDYDTKTTPVPVIAARGQGPLAARMRMEAEDAGVPIIRNVYVARRLWARGEVGEIVPEEMFDAIAEIILWAQKARRGEAPMTKELGAHALTHLGEE